MHNTPTKVVWVPMGNFISLVQKLWQYKVRVGKEVDLQRDGAHVRMVTAKSAAVLFELDVQ